MNLIDCHRGEDESVRPTDVVDLFCGAGGLTHGLKRAGLNVVAGIDNDPGCRHAYESNNSAGFLEAAIEELHPRQIEELFTKGCTFRALVGCAPCQPFSSYVPTSKKNDDRNSANLLDAFAALILAVKPDFISMENVPRIISFKGGSVLRAFVEKLSDSYYLSSSIVSCCDYGIPQTRRRFVLLGSRHGPLELPAPTHRDDPPTVKQAIGWLEPIAAGETHPDDRLHRAAGLGDKNLRRIRASRPGGTWEDWPSELLSACHRGEAATFRNVYGRMEWDAPAPTITTGSFNYGRGRFGHPTQDRAISLREAALLQTFPVDYEFVDATSDVRFSHVARLIGNAVPVRLGEVIGEAVHDHAGRL